MHVGEGICYVATVLMPNTFCTLAQIQYCILKLWDYGKMIFVLSWELSVNEVF